MIRLHNDDPTADWTVPDVYEVDPGLYRIPLPLPHDHLKAVNVYAVRDGDGLVLVDSGWALTQARDLLEEAVKTLDCTLPEIRRFLVTHVHRDHYTMAVDSLKLVRGLPDRRLLPAHGPVSPSVHARVDELLDHHDTRLRRIEELVDRQAGTAAEVAGRLRWTRRERRLDELDLFNRCLAVSETLAHLDVLAVAGRLRRSDLDGISHYAKA